MEAVIFPASVRVRTSGFVCEAGARCSGMWPIERTVLSKIIKFARALLIPSYGWADEGATVAILTRVRSGADWLVPGGLVCVPKSAFANLTSSQPRHHFQARNRFSYRAGFAGFTTMSGRTVAD